MDQATQQNAALVEQSAAAAESLSHQANLLLEAVTVFRLDASGQAPAAMARPPAITTVRQAEPLRLTDQHDSAA